MRLRWDLGRPSSSVLILGSSPTPEGHSPHLGWLRFPRGDLGGEAGYRGALGLDTPRSVLGLGSGAGRSDPVMAVGSARQGAGVVMIAASVGEAFAPASPRNKASPQEPSSSRGATQARGVETGAQIDGVTDCTESAGTS